MNGSETQGGFNLKHLKYHTSQGNKLLALLSAKGFISSNMRVPQFDLSLLQGSTERQKPTCSQPLHKAYVHVRQLQEQVTIWPLFYLNYI